MLDLRMIRQNPEKVREGLRKIGEDTAQVDQILALDEKRRSMLTEVEQLKAERNTVSDEIARMKKGETGCHRDDRAYAPGFPADQGF